MSKYVPLALSLSLSLSASPCLSSPSLRRLEVVLRLGVVGGDLGGELDVLAGRFKGLASSCVLVYLCVFYVQLLIVLYVV